MKTKVNGKNLEISLTKKEAKVLYLMLVETRYIPPLKELSENDYAHEKLLDKLYEFAEGER